jgi:carboxylate-amine ligase
MSTLEEELAGWRATAAAAARRIGVRLVASGTSPVPAVPQRVRTTRYDRMAHQYGIVAREQLTCGCHVHVSVESDDEAVGVLDRIRVWLPGLLALSANSPYWHGEDTDYASFRWQALSRWPTSGPTEVFGSALAYRAVVDSLVASEAILDEGMLYYDARCSASYPTVEFRVADVCSDVGDAVLLAALCRGLVDTAAEGWAAGEPAPAVPTPLVRLATWQAARWGISDRLLDPLTSLPHPAHEIVSALVEHIRPALDLTGDLDLVAARIAQIRARGNGASRQREAHRGSGQLGDVVVALVRDTVRA